MNRRGKKMGTFNVRIKDSSQPLADVEYRFDSKTGKFFAEFSDQEFENESRRALQIAIEECVRSRAVVDYEPMIHVQLPAEYTHSWRTRAASEQLRAEIRLSYDLILVSKQTFEHDTRAEKYRLTKVAHVDATGALAAAVGTDGRRWPNDDRPYDVLIPYTPARLDALKAIQAAIKDTRDRLLDHGPGDSGRAPEESGSVTTLSKYFPAQPPSARCNHCRGNCACPGPRREGGCRAGTCTCPPPKEAEPTLVQLERAGIVSSDPNTKRAKPVGSSPALRIACPICRVAAGAYCLKNGRNEVQVIAHKRRREEEERTR